MGPEEAGVQPAEVTGRFTFDASSSYIVRQSAVAGLHSCSLREDPATDEKRSPTVSTMQRGHRRFEKHSDGVAQERRLSN